MPDIARIAIFCGSNFGRGDVYREATQALGTALAQAGIEIVYGGTHKGLMGVVADAALAAGGRVHGVITERLVAREHLHKGLTSHEVVATMRLRKQRMAELSDAFVALPGGIGTLEEFAEVWTLNQLGDISKPAGFYDIAGFYGEFLKFVDHMVAEQFLPQAHRAAVVQEATPDALIAALRAWVPNTTPKWM
jgi:uncharacterized protein (TIGR00730 family)